LIHTNTVTYLNVLRFPETMVNDHKKERKQHKYLCKWKFATIYGWQRKQKTVWASNKLEAEKQLFPYTYGIDKIISIERVK